eukprot:Ihof_evm2s812 gene=Ihof_evmTU2s812
MASIPAEQFPNTQGDNSSASPGGTTQESEIDELFIKHTIAEIKDVEKKTRNDIEKKKEDLRQMVGERYRDLIDAADTIMDMTESTRQVVTTIKHLQEQCGSINDSGTINKAVPVAALPHPHTSKLLSKQVYEDVTHRKNIFHAIATSMKLLVDTPEHIWNALEAQHYLKASQLYLLARQIFTNLRVNKLVAPSLFSSFPILSVQWCAISSFKMEILAGCQAQLRRTDLTDNDTGCALVAIMVMANKTSEQVLDEFLKARLDALSLQFRSQEKESITVAVKIQICQAIGIVQATLSGCSAIFSRQPDDMPSGLLHTILDDSTQITPNWAPTCPMDFILHSSANESDINISTLSKLFGYNSNTLTLLRHLPSELQNFKPSCSAEARVPVLKETLQSKCSKWLQDCQKEMEEGVPTLLHHVITARALAACREAVWTQLTRREEGVETRPWKTICETTLGMDRVCLWSVLLSHLFLQHTVNLVKSYFAALPLVLEPIIGQGLQSLKDGSAIKDMDIGRYMWSEGSTDLDSVRSMDCTPIRSTGISNKHKPANLTWLTLKATGITPQVFSVCEELDKRLEVILVDVRSVLDVSSTGDDVVPRSFERSTNADEVREVLIGACVESINIICTNMQKLLDGLKDQLNENKEDYIGLVTSALYLGRIARALADYSLQLPECMKLSTKPVEIAQSTRRVFHSSRKKSLEAAEAQDYDTRLSICRDTLDRVDVLAVNM